MADEQPKIEEILGYNSAVNTDSESITRRFYVRHTDPTAAKAYFENYAASLAVPLGLVLSEVTLEEEKSAKNLYYGTIKFASPNPRLKYKIANDLYEMYGEKMSEARTNATHERTFRVYANNAASALDRLEGYIRDVAQTSGRLHIDDISVDESSDGDGYFIGRVVYSNPSTRGDHDKISGVVHAYGDRFASTRTSQSREHIYELRGYNSVQDAWSALSNNFGWNPDVESIDVDEDSSGANRLFTGRVRYARELEDTSRSVSFEVSGSQSKMTQSLATRGGWSARGKPRNYGGLIGVTDDGVEGVDIDTAVSTFSETVKFYSWYLTSSYVAFLARAYGCMNSAPFRGFLPGEVRFLGASGSYRSGDNMFEMTFKFAVSPNAWNIQIGDMCIPFKYGWDYLWVRWADMNQDGVTVKIPIEAYVEQVYQPLHFGLLGIG